MAFLATAVPPDQKAAPVRPAAPGFREIYADNLGYVWRVVRRLGVRPADVEDVCQEVFVVVHRKLAEFAGRSSVRTWLYGIAFRCASDHRRRAHVRREVATAEPDLGAVDGGQLESVDRRRARALLDDILDQLDDDKRAVFVFYEIEQLPMAEVAEILDCPLQTAYSRLRAARAHVEAAAGRLRAAEAHIEAQVEVTDD